MNSRLPLLLSLSLFSCGAPPASESEPTETSAPVSQSQALSDGTPATTGVLAFLNDPSTTLAVLDQEVPLNALAAQNLMAWRAGPDGVAHTGDDRTFVTIDQVDDVPYVGPAALADLEWYARGTGRVADLPLDASVGVFDGLAFNLAEARRVIKVANTESGTSLQTVYGLSPLAVQSLLAARPIVHMVELSRLPNVDGATLQQLKNMTQLAPAGDPCTGQNTCQAGLVCEGIPYDGSSIYGRCINPASVPGEGDSCSVFTPCQAGLFCRGIPSGASEGWCRPAWMAGTFTKYAELHLAASTTNYASPVAVVGLATVPDDIVVELDLVHTAPHRLVLTLEDPGGDTALLWNGPAEGTPPARISVTRGISRDSTINGRWLLRITNPSGVGSGTLRSWTLDLNSRYD
ncbi:proprotein convertase P-domain-containing protein [Pyxidicoccus sp. 3LFB2]